MGGQTGTVLCTNSLVATGVAQAAVGRLAR